MSGDLGAPNHIRRTVAYPIDYAILSPMAPESMEPARTHWRDRTALQRVPSEALSYGYSLEQVFAETEKIVARPLPDVVRSLVCILGGPNVAVIGGVTKTSALAEWIRGDREPKSQDREMRLRLALQLAVTIKARHGDKTVRAWFLGANHRLGDEMPIALVARAPLAEVQRDLLAAARAFVDL
jgi:hypothetical protein